MTETEIINYWIFEILCIEGGALRLEAFGSRSKEQLLFHALRENRTVFLDIFFDYYNVPKGLSFKERIAFYELLEHP